MQIRVCDSCGENIDKQSSYQINVGIFEAESKDGKAGMPRVEVCGVCFEPIRIVINNVRKLGAYANAEANSCCKS